jgi:CysZ protein
MIVDAFAAFAETFSPLLRRILLKAIGLALLLLVVLGTIFHGLLTGLFSLPGIFETALAIIAGLGIFAGAIFLVPPITSLIAAFFVDDIAEYVERANFPADLPGRPLPFVQSIVISTKFFAIVLAVNFLALLLLLVPGINIAIFFFANAYLLSREYFELAAMRHRPVAEARALRRSHAVQIFIAGFMIAGIVAVPVLNLITPVFATAYMVRLHKRLSPSRELLPPERVA